MVPPAPTAVALLDACAPTANRSAAAALVCTVIVAVPLFPSLVAVMVAEPPVTPVTSPVPDTVATAKGLPAHVTARPASRLPAASFVAAASCAVAPTPSVAEEGVTVTDATGAEGLVGLPPPPPPPQAARIRLVPMSNQGRDEDGVSKKRPPKRVVVRVTNRVFFDEGLQGMGHSTRRAGIPPRASFVAAGCRQGAAVSKQF